MSKQRRSYRYNGETVPEFVREPDGPSTVPDALSGLLGVHSEFAPPSTLSPVGQGLGGVLSAYSMWLAGNDMAENGPTATNIADMTAGVAGLTSAVAGATPVGRVANSFSTGYAVGKTGDAGTAWVAPDNRGISDRMADKAVQAELDMDDLFGEDSTAGDVAGAVTMFSEIMRPGSFTEHMMDAATERAAEEITEWWTDEEEEEEVPLHLTSIGDVVAESVERAEEKQRAADAADAATAALAVADATHQRAEAEAYAMEVAAQEEAQAQAIAAAMAAEQAAEEEEPGLVSEVFDAAGGFLSDLW